MCSLVVLAAAAVQIPRELRKLKQSEFESLFLSH